MSTTGTTISQWVNGTGPGLHGPAEPADLQAAVQPAVGVRHEHRRAPLVDSDRADAAGGRATTRCCEERDLGEHRRRQRLDPDGDRQPAARDRADGRAPVLNAHDKETGKKIGTVKTAGRPASTA